MSTVYAFLVGAYTSTFSKMITLSPLLLLCPSKNFRHESKNTPSIFNNVFKTFYLLKKYVAEIQLSGNGIRLFSMPQSSSQSSGMACAGLWNGIWLSHTISLGMVTRTWSTLYLQRQFLIYTILHCGYSGNV